MVLVERGGAAGTGGGGALMGSSEAAPSWRTESAVAKLSGVAGAMAVAARPTGRGRCDSKAARPRT
jgi:hypothetical protein